MFLSGEQKPATNIHRPTSSNEESNQHEIEIDEHTEEIAGNDMEYIFFGSSGDEENESDEDVWLP